MVLKEQRCFEVGTTKLRYNIQIRKPLFLSNSGACFLKVNNQKYFMYIIDALVFCVSNLIEFFINNANTASGRVNNSLNYV